MNNWYAVEELTHQHQSELEREAARKASARAARGTGAPAGMRSLLAGMITGLRVARDAVVHAGHHGAIRPLRPRRVHRPHHHVPAAR